MKHRSRSFSINRSFEKAFIAVGAIAAMSAIGFAGYKFISNIDSASANNLLIELSLDAPYIGGVTYSKELDAEREIYTPNPVSEMYGDNALPTRYNSHDLYPTVRTKNQNTEGLCWAYAASTTAEYALRKQNIETTISPKQLDYQFVDASAAYIESNVSNKFYENWLAMGGYARSFGDGGNVYTAMLTLTNKNTLISESKFTEIIKANDTRLSSINNYEDIWKLNNYEDILAPNGDAMVYNKKQHYSAINNSNNNQYIADGVGIIYYPIYGVSNTKTELVNYIKQVIKEYGAAEVATYYDPVNCMSYASVNNEKTDAYVTVIDRTTNNSTVCNASSGHAMTLIGWDDNFAYTDKDANATQKTGAFIIQNSYGEDETQNVSIEGVSTPLKMHYYYSYESAFTILYFTHFAQIGDYDHIYDINDYKTSTITPSSNEYIFEFTTNGEEELKKITFNQNFRAVESYDLYISTTGRDADFVKATNFSAGMGMTALDVTGKVSLSGNFAIKLVLTDTDATAISDTERYIDLLNAYTVDAGNPDPDPEDPCQENPNLPGCQDPEPPVNEEKTYTLHIDLNGGTGKMSDQTCTGTATDPCDVVIPRTEPERDNYVFFGYSRTKSTVENPFMPGDNFQFTAGEYEVTLYATWANGTSTWPTGEYFIQKDPEDISITIDYPMYLLEKVYVDDEELSSENYRVRAGSTIITLSSTYLKTLELGKHVVKVAFDLSSLEETEKVHNIIKIVDGIGMVETAFYVIENDEDVPDTSLDEPTSIPDTGRFSAEGKSANLNIIIPISVAATILMLIVFKKSFGWRHLRYQKNK